MTTLAAAPGAAETHIDIGGRSIRVTNLDRVVWPLTGMTKRELIAYYVEVAPVLLPHVRQRATMLWRFPEGVDGPGWFQAQCRGRPDWVPTHDIVARRGDRLSYCLVEEPATLAWLANLGTIELHPHNWTIDRPGQPSALVFDLDPGPPAGLTAAAQVAMAIRGRLDAAGVEARVKTSGGLGLHVVAPLDAEATFEWTKTFARDVAERMAAERPELVIATSGRSDRPGRVYIDWIQNDPNRQMVAPYSPRATPVPGVSTPVTWAEVQAVASGEASEATLRFTPGDLLERIARFGDIWAPQR